MHRHGGGGGVLNTIEQRRWQRWPKTGGCAARAPVAVHTRSRHGRTTREQRTHMRAYGSEDGMTRTLTARANRA
eukprot:874484-Pleurochrysis_carterae.AAC.1